VKAENRHSVSIPLPPFFPQTREEAGGFDLTRWQVEPLAERDGLGRTLHSFLPISSPLFLAPLVMVVEEPLVSDLPHPSGALRGTPFTFLL